jgi:hypothetical protein
MSTITTQAFACSKEPNTITKLSSLPNSGSYTKSYQIFSFYSYSLLAQPQIGCVFRPGPFNEAVISPSTGEAPDSAMAGFLGPKDIQVRGVQEE